MRTLITALLLAAPFAVPAQSRPGIDTICGSCQVEKVASCGAGKFIEGPAFDEKGTLWVTALRAGEIMKVEGNRCETVHHIGGAPNGAKFDAAGQMVITDRNRNLIVLNPATGVVTPLRNKRGSETLRGLNDNVLDRAGGIYFTESYGSDILRPVGRVFYLPPATSTNPNPELLTLADNLAFPNGIALSPDEKTLYVTEGAKSRIVAVPLSAPGTVNLSGIPYLFARLENGVGPDGMAVDAKGNVYTAHFGAGEVVVHTPQGFLYGAIRLPAEAGLGVTNVALHDGYLYLTESFKNDIWRVKLSDR